MRTSGLGHESAGSRVKLLSAPATEARSPPTFSGPIAESLMIHVAGSLLGVGVAEGEGVVVAESDGAGAGLATVGTRSALQPATARVTSPASARAVTNDERVMCSPNAESWCGKIEKNPPHE